jgi:hypothetical protein
MDFIMGLPKVQGKDCIFVVVDSVNVLKLHRIDLASR